MGSWRKNRIYPRFPGGKDCREAVIAGTDGPPYQRRPPPLNVCCVCQNRDVPIFYCEIRPTGRMGKNQWWPHCKECWYWCNPAEEDDPRALELHKGLSGSSSLSMFSVVESFEKGECGAPTPEGLDTEGKKARFGMPTRWDP